MKKNSVNKVTVDKYVRGDFGQFKTYPAFVQTLIDELINVGSFTPGIDSDKKHRRGTSINIDVYGWHVEMGLAVIQVRQCRFHPRWWNHVRKDYYLIGRNESMTVFSHPCSSPARSSIAMVERPEETVYWVEREIFRCTERQRTLMVRQGDLAFVPAAIPSEAEPVPVDALTVDADGSHLLKADTAFIHEAVLYVRGPATMIHLKGQHAPVEVPKGSWRVQVGYREPTWGFTRPTRD